MKRSRQMQRAMVAGVVATAMLGLVACGRGGDDSDSGGSKDITVALVTGLPADAFYKKVELAGRAEAKRLGVELMYDGPTEFTAAKQIPVLDATLTKKPDALAVSPIDPLALRSTLNRWSKADIPVITFDSTLTDSPFALTSEVSSNNFAGGELAADLLAKEIGGKGQVALISTDTSNLVQYDRNKGFVARLKEKYPNVELVSTQLVAADFPRAQTIIQTLATKYPDLAGFFTTCSFCTEYAAKGLEGINAQDRIAQVGYEAGPKEIQYLKKGTLRAVVAQDPAKEGTLAVRYAVMAAQGKAADIPKKVQLDPVAITVDNVDEMSKYYYFDPEEN